MCSVAREVASSPWDESEAAADTDGVPGLAGEEFVQLMGSLAPAFLLAHGEWAIREIFRGCLPLAESYVSRLSAEYSIRGITGVARAMDMFVCIMSI